MLSLLNVNKCQQLDIERVLSCAPEQCQLVTAGYHVTERVSRYMHVRTFCAYITYSVSPHACSFVYYAVECSHRSGSVRNMYR
jgi:hypothetical protein